MGGTQLIVQPVALGAIFGEIRILAVEPAQEAVGEVAASVAV